MVKMRVMNEAKASLSYSPEHVVKGTLSGPIIAGKSAYEIAQIYGFEGTVEEWLESLIGDSAYEVAVKNGFEGDEEAWLKSLIGLTDYEIAVKHGFEGDEVAWLETLIGSSAYEVAVDNGFKGDQEAWLKSLIGLSAYEVAVKNGFEGDEAAWLESLKAKLNIDENVFSLDGETLTLAGAQEAQPNTFPTIAEDGKMKWVEIKNATPDLSINDENNDAYVAGVLQNRHLPEGYPYVGENSSYFETQDDNSVSRLYKVLDYVPELPYDVGRNDIKYLIDYTIEVSAIINGQTYYETYVLASNNSSICLKEYSNYICASSMNDSTTFFVVILEDNSQYGDLLLNKGLYLIYRSLKTVDYSTCCYTSKLITPNAEVFTWDGEIPNPVHTMSPDYIPPVEKRHLPEGYPWGEKRETIDFRIPLTSNEYCEGTFYHVSDEHLNWNASVNGDVSVSAIVNGSELTESMSAVEMLQMSQVSTGFYVFNQNFGILYCEEDNTDIPLDNTVIHVQKRGLYFGDFCFIENGNILGSVKIVSFTYFDGMTFSWDGSPYIIEKMDPKFLQIEQHNLPEGYPWKHESGQVKIDMTKFFEVVYGGSFPPETMMLVHVSDEIPPLEIGKQVETVIQFGPDQVQVYSIIEQVDDYSCLFTDNDSATPYCAVVCYKDNHTIMLEDASIFVPKKGVYFVYINGKQIPGIPVDKIHTSGILFSDESVVLWNGEVESGITKLDSKFLPDGYPIVKEKLPVISLSEYYRLYKIMENTVNPYIFDFVGEDVYFEYTYIENGNVNHIAETTTLESIQSSCVYCMVDDVGLVIAFSKVDEMGIPSAGIWATKVEDVDYGEFLIYPTSLELPDGTVITWNGDTNNIVSTMDPALLPPGVPIVKNAEVGQVIIVSRTEDGVPVEYEATDVFPPVSESDVGKIMHVNAEKRICLDHPLELILTDTVTSDLYAIFIQNGNLATKRLFVDIQITSPPTKTFYYYGEDIDVTGMVVEGIYPDGTSEVITDYSLDYPKIDKSHTSIAVTYFNHGKILNVHYDNLEVDGIDTSELIDFEYVQKENGIYELKSWKGTTNGQPSTEIIIPDSSFVII